MARLLWSQREDVGPSPRAASALAYDQGKKHVLLYGGSVGTGELHDTWRWDGSTWMQLEDIGPNTNVVLAYDADRSRHVAHAVVGGPQTWEWDGTAWTQVADTGPAAVIAPSLRTAYVARRRRVTAVNAPNQGSVQTWEWDGSAWSQVADTGPTLYAGFDLAFDSAAAQLVLYGGIMSGEAVTETWTWDGTTWTRRADIGPARIYHRMAFDEDRKRVVLYGGGIPQGPKGGLADAFPAADPQGTTWEWDGARWTQVQDMGPPARQLHGQVYASAWKRTVAFGGSSLNGNLGDTWEFGEYP
jgi:hypothetical protein